MNTRISKQADFCNTLMSKLMTNIAGREKRDIEYRENTKNDPYHFAYVDMPRGGYKTQIQSDITRLRRELAELSQTLNEPEDK